MATFSKKIDCLVFFRVDNFILWSMWQVGIRVSTEPCFLIIILRPIVSLKRLLRTVKLVHFVFNFFIRGIFQCN